MIWFAKKYRITITRIFGVILSALFLFSSYSWKKVSTFDLIIECCGFLLILVCTFGRLWTLMYICGYKTNKLITEGPYSMVRNPLYFFSLMGAVGIGLSSKNILALALIVIMFATYYPFVILAEEKRLIDVHKEEFIEYMKKTPRFIPRLSLLHEPELYNVNARLYRRSFFGAVLFILFFMILQIIEWLHDTGILPVFFRIP